MIKLKRIKELTHFIDTVPPRSLFVAVILNFKYWWSTGPGSGTKTFTGVLEAQQNGRSDRSPRIFAMFLEIPKRFFGF